MDVDTLPPLAINNLLMFWSVEGGCVTCDWKNNMIINMHNVPFTNYHFPSPIV
jgi:hypothetical protein